VISDVGQKDKKMNNMIKAIIITLIAMIFEISAQEYLMITKDDQIQSIKKYILESDKAIQVNDKELDNELKQIKEILENYIYINNEFPRNALIVELKYNKKLLMKILPINNIPKLLKLNYDYDKMDEILLVANVNILRLTLNKIANGIVTNPAQQGNAPEPASPAR
jgi:hypothetical protein